MLRWRLLTLILTFALLGAGPSTPQHAASIACVTFPETGKQVCDYFLEYWQASGGLAKQGLPISEVFLETNPADGRTYQVQYFERARFEYHPENRPPYDVLLGLIGREQFRAKYPGEYPDDTPGPQLVGPGAVCFPVSGKCVLPEFYAYWEANGGLAQFGYPITHGFMETNPTDGRQYYTAYFERARFEYHPENSPPYDVLLGLLGREQFLVQYPDGLPVPSPPGAGPAYGARIEPSALDFGEVRVGAISAPLTVSLTNTGTETQVWGGADGFGPRQFRFVTISETCTISEWTSGATCQLMIEFRPTAIGTTTAAWSVTDPEGRRLATLTLRGTGVADSVVSVPPAAPLDP